MNITGHDIAPLLPVFILLGSAVSSLMIEVFSPRRRSAPAAVTGFGFLVAAGLFGWQVGEPGRALFVADGAVALFADDFGRVTSVLLLTGATLVLLGSARAIEDGAMARGEYHALLSLSMIGMVVMVMSGDLLTFFLGLETLSVSLYALTAMRGNDSRATEAALKYFLMGAFATGFFLFGLAFTYGAIGRLDWAWIGMHLASGEADPLLAAGLLLVLVGFGFKIAAAPFHMWAPDVYEAAATPVTAFMAVGVKTAALGALVRAAVSGLSPGLPAAGVGPIGLLVGLSATSIVVGNLLALTQTSVKRLLAYSSIAHAGYALIGVVAAARGTEGAASAVLFFLSAYTFTTIGAFGVLGLLERADGASEAERLSAYAGIGRSHPALAAAMALFMVALAGMPPTGAFLAKIQLFGAALRAGEVTLVVIGVLGSVVGAFVYLRVLVAFYLREHREPGPAPHFRPAVAPVVGVGLAVALTLGLGLLPGAWIAAVDGAGLSLAPREGAPNP